MELSRAQPGMEQETCLIGSGGRHCHIRELGSGGAGALLSGLTSQVAMLHGVCTGDQEHPPLGASGAQRAFAASGVTRGIALCPSYTSEPAGCLPDCCL